MFNLFQSGHYLLDLAVFLLFIFARLNRSLKPLDDRVAKPNRLDDFFSWTCFLVILNRGRYITACVSLFDVIKNSQEMLICSAYMLLSLI